MGCSEYQGIGELWIIRQGKPLKGGFEVLELGVSWQVALGCMFGGLEMGEDSEGALRGWDTYGKVLGVGGWNTWCRFLGEEQVMEMGWGSLQDIGTELWA